MTIIELPDDQVGALTAKAAAQGLTLQAWFASLVKDEAGSAQRPLKTGRGPLAKYGPAPSAEEIRRKPDRDVQQLRARLTLRFPIVPEA